jgi:tRNA (guanine37-N1)-methyltransferase
MLVDILTLFPEMFEGPFKYSILKRAQEKELLKINIVNLRDFATDKYKSVDDRPYGGGAGMVMRVDIIDKAIQSVRAGEQESGNRVILTDAGGERFVQKKARELSVCEHLIIICGHYEGVDARVKEHLVDEVISVGDYVLSGGELPAMTIIDSVTRLIPGVLGNEESLNEESHNVGEIEYPQFTRPDEYKGWKVPDILLSGDHKKIEEWRKTRQSDPGR